MKTTRLLCASLATLLAVCLTHAADTKPIPRVLSILEVETEDPGAYVSRIASYNQAAKTKLGVDNFLRVFESYYDGQKSGRLRAVVAASSVAELNKYSVALEKDLETLQKQLRGTRQTGGRLLYQAVRFDGTDRGGSLYNTLAVVTDEAGYLKALDQLRTIFDSAGFKDAKINVYRLLAGRTDHTHRINISLPNAERLAGLMDVLGTSHPVAEWLAASAKYRTVVSNSTSRELTR